MHGRGHIYYTPERIAALVPATLRERWGARIRENLKAARHAARAKGIALAEQLAHMARRQRKGRPLSFADLERALSFAPDEARAYYDHRPRAALAAALNKKIHFGYTLEEAGARLGLPFAGNCHETPEAREARIARLVKARKAKPEAPKPAPACATPLQRAAVSRYRNCATCKHAGLARCNRFPSLRADPAKVCEFYHFDGAHYGVTAYA